MKRLLRPLAVGAVTASLITGVAGAQSSGCSIVNTGPGSVNSCQADNNSNLTITCDNKVQINTVNGQYTTSGNTAVIDNTSGGYAYSGNAVTTNSSTNTLNVSCVTAAAQTTPVPTPSQPAAPVVSGSTTSQKAASLPNTGSNPLAVTAIAAGVLGAIAAASRLGAKLYSSVRS